MKWLLRICKTVILILAFLAVSDMFLLVYGYFQNGPRFDAVRSRTMSVQRGKAAIRFVGLSGRFAYFAT
mgnify:FL=1